MHPHSRQKQTYLVSNNIERKSSQIHPITWTKMQLLFKNQPTIKTYCRSGNPNLITHKQTVFSLGFFLKLPHPVLPTPKPLDWCTIITTSGKKGENKTDKLIRKQSRKSFNSHPSADPYTVVNNAGIFRPIERHAWWSDAGKAKVDAPPRCRHGRVDLGEKANELGWSWGSWRDWSF